MGDSGRFLVQDSNNTGRIFVYFRLQLVRLALLDELYDSGQGAVYVAAIVRDLSDSKRSGLHHVLPVNFCHADVELAAEAIGKKAQELLSSLPESERSFGLASVSPEHWWYI